MDVTNNIIPFFPKLKKKANALKPLMRVAEFNNDGKIVAFSHPYEYELDQVKVDRYHLQRRDIIMPPPLELTLYEYVDRVSQLPRVLQEIGEQREVAFDVQMHKYHSYLGVCCLVVISIPFKDYIFDALRLGDEMEALNEVLTNPAILKISHSAEADLKLLQHSHSLYVVNMFDTRQAAMALRMPPPLGYQLLQFCGVRRPKIGHPVDWRQRPLAGAYLCHARLATHYLAYISQCMRNELLENDYANALRLRRVFQFSNDLCKKRFAYPVIYHNSHMRMYIDSKKKFDGRQLAALQQMFLWRDAVARDADESWACVLNNRSMLQIAEMMPLSRQGILECCCPDLPYVRQHLDTIYDIVYRAYYS